MSGDIIGTEDNYSSGFREEHRHLASVSPSLLFMQSDMVKRLNLHISAWFSVFYNEVLLSELIFNYHMILL